MAPREHVSVDVSIGRSTLMRQVMRLLEFDVFV